MITVNEWNEHCARVTKAMEQYVAQFVTPLSVSESFGVGTAWGSGTYVQGNDQTWILTAAHVIDRVPLSSRLGHLPVPGDQYIAVSDEPVLAAWPIDAAALPVHRDTPLSPPTQRIVPKNSIAVNYAPIDEEVLFWMGFPGYVLDRNDIVSDGKLRVSIFDQLSTPAKPMLTQAMDSNIITASNFDPSIHIAVHYPETAIRAKDGQIVDLPKADGMSGSALWDTKFLACALEGKPWNPQMAEICGVVWAVLDKPEAIIVTKIEKIRSSLPNVFS